MRKVTLTMNQNNRYEIIKKFVEVGGNKKRIALQLDCSQRHINRMIQGYRQQGKEYFSHKNKGRKPKHGVSEELKQRVVTLYLEEYGTQANFRHFTQLLKKNEKIDLSESTIRNILDQARILSPKAHRKTKKKYQEELRQQQKNAPTKKEKQAIEETILSLQESHPRKERHKYAGELLQMDASLHPWFGDKKITLHLAIDDATGNIVGAHFEEQETLRGYYRVLEQILMNYGIPYTFFTDRRTVFEYTQKKSSDVAEDHFTQFGYALKQLGVQLKTSSIPQAKGRVERCFGTLQSRLCLEMKLANIQTLEQANEFLNSYLKKFNAQFGLSSHPIKSVYESKPTKEEIQRILSVLSTRKMDAGHCIKYNHHYYRLLDENGSQVYYRRGTEGLVIHTLTGELYMSVNEKIYCLEEVPLHQKNSPNFDAAPKEPKKPRYIPPMSHPWKKASFEQFLRKQAHRAGA